METLNFHHLRYFWLVVQEGGVLPASRRLKVSHPTVSAQLRELENWLDVPLFDRRGRRLELTEAGKATFNYADRIFSLGREFLDVVPSGNYERSLRVGVTDDLPKLVIRDLLAPFFEVRSPTKLVVEEERHRSLLSRLAVRDLDLVLSDAPTPAAFRMEVVDHELGRSDVSILAAPALAERLVPGFPKSLEGAPWLMAPRESYLGRAVSTWMRDHEINLRVVAEIADSALIKTLGADGIGAFALPQVAVEQACARYGVQVVGPLDGVEISFYLTSGSDGGAEDEVKRLIEKSRAGLRPPISPEEAVKEE